MTSCPLLRSCCCLAMLTLACESRKVDSPQVRQAGADAAYPAHGAGLDSGALLHDAGARAPASCSGDICIVAASSAEQACIEGEGARLRAAGVEFTHLACKQVHTALNPHGLRQRAALLELQDEEFDTPLVLAFGGEGFTNVAQLISIDDGVGSAGTYQVERFDVLDLVPGGAPELILILNERTESWEDAPPGPIYKELTRWLFVCASEPDPACATLLLASNTRAHPTEPLQHGKFSLRFTLQSSTYRLERATGEVPRSYRALLGEHDVASLIAALARK